MFKYLFYRIFQFQFKVIGEERSTAAFTAFLSVAMFWGLNLFSFFIMFDKNIDLFGFFEKLTPKSDILVPVFTASIIGLVSYFKFYYKLKYNNIINEIQNADSKNRSMSNFWAVVYQLVSLIILISAVIYRFK